jgi:hypothetical protein
MTLPASGWAQLHALLRAHRLVAPDPAPEPHHCD